MKKLFKVIGWMFVGLLTIILIIYGVVVSYKKEILAAVSEKMSESFNGEVQVGDFAIALVHDFPNISLSLKDVYLRGPQYKKYKRDFLRADVVDLNVDALKLLQKQLNIKSIDVINGDAFVFRTKGGYLNLDVFKKQDGGDTTGTDSRPSIHVDKMSFKNVSLAFHDSLNQKLFGATLIRVENRMAETDSSIRAQLRGNIDFAGLTFNSAKGSFLKNKQTNADLNLEFFFPSKRLVIEPSSLTLEKSVIHVSGRMQFLHPGGDFQISIQSDKVDYEEGLAVVTQNMRSSLREFSIEKPIAIEVLVNGQLGSSKPPATEGTFAIRDSHVSWSEHELQKTFVQGSFTNHRDDLLPFDDVNTEIKLDSVKGIIKSFPFRGAIRFNDLTNPFLNLSLLIDSDLKNINVDLDTTRLRFTEGHFTSNILFAGNLGEYFDDTITKYNGKLQGETQINGGKLMYLTKRITLDSINALFRFTEAKFDIEKVSMRLNKNPVLLTGTVSGFIPFFLLPEKQGKVSLKISSPSLDLTGIMSGPSKQKVAAKKGNSRKKVSDLIDNLYEKLEFDLDFDISKIRSKDIYGTGLTGKIILANNRLQALRVKMNMAKGRVEFSATLSQLQKNINPLALSAIVRNADIKTFFYMFHNFQQKSIRSEHIAGRLFADIRVTAAINDNFEVLMSRLHGNVAFNVVNGRIRNYEPLEHMSNFLMKNRDFSDVHFGEIKGNFDINGSEVDISRMEVESTVLTLFLEGRYSLKDNTNLSIQVPLSNLKKRNQKFAPENVGTHARIGMSVHLRAYEKEGKTVIAFAPFSKKR